jgi:hypothetical protein
MEIIGSIIGIFFALVLPPEITASPNINVPFELIQEYQTKEECQIAIDHTDDICTTEPDLYLGTRQYSRVSDRGEVHTDIVCNSISGCAVDPSAKTEEEYCPTCIQSKWYFMNN